MKHTAIFREANPMVKSAIAEIAAKAVANGISFILSKEDAVIYSGDTTQTPCSGYFCGNDQSGEKILAVATGKPLKQWLPVLLHESSHMDQYLEDCDAWKNIVMPDGTDSSDALFEWIGGKDVENPRDLAIRSLQVELDCEKRTVQKIIDFGLEDYIEPLEYIQKANAYIYFYLYVLETRKFYTKGNEPYTNAMVWSAAPSHFAGDYTKIPELLHEAFRKYM